MMRSPSRVVLAVAFLAFGFASAHARAEDAVMPDLPPAPEPPPAPAPEPATAPPAAPAPAAPAPAAPAPAPAIEESIHPLPVDEKPSRWYGWQTLAADGASLVLIVGSISLADSGGDSPSAALGWGALGTYVLGAPIIHLAHGNPGRGFGSLGMRVGGPILLGIFGAMAEDCGNGGGDFCGLGGALLGATTGIVAAVAIDAAVFAYDDRPESNGASVPRFQLGISPRGVVASGTF